MTNRCCVCNALIGREDEPACLVVDGFPVPLKVCGDCLNRAHTYDGEFRIGCISREELARLILAQAQAWE